jgi:hypothetical protein
MSPFERAVLIATAKGREFISWYRIDRRLSLAGVQPTLEHLPTVLKRLSEQGMLEQHSVDKTRFRVTELGLARLREPTAS